MISKDTKTAIECVDLAGKLILFIGGIGLTKSAINNVCKPTGIFTSIASTYVGIAVGYKLASKFNLMDLLEDEKDDEEDEDEREA